MTLLINQFVDPIYSFFTETESKRLIYPNVLANMSHPDDYRQYFEFFGKIIGKAIYEGILLKCKFADFFLNKFVGKSN